MDYKKIKEYLKKITQKKNTNYLIVLFLIGIILVIAASFFKGGNTSTTQTSSKSVQSVDTTTTKSSEENLEQDEKKLQDKLKNTLEQMEGVGKTSVMIYFESGSEEVPAVNSNDSVSNTEEKDTNGGTRNTTQQNNGNTVVTTNDDNGTTKPLIVKTIKPKITGIFIIAEGADNKKIQLEITEAVVDLFNVSYDKVNVYPMKK